MQTRVQRWLLACDGGPGSELLAAQMLCDELRSLLPEALRCSLTIRRPDGGFELLATSAQNGTAPATGPDPGADRRDEACFAQAIDSCRPASMPARASEYQQGAANGGALWDSTWWCYPLLDSDRHAFAVISVLMPSGTVPDGFVAEVLEALALQGELVLRTLRLRNRERAIVEGLSEAGAGIVISERVAPGVFRTQFVNRGFEALTGYAASEVLGRDCSFLQGPERDQSGVREMREAIAAACRCRVTLRNYRKDGSPFWNSMTLAPLRGHHGEVTHYIGILQDVSEAREAAERRIRSEALLTEAQAIAHFGSWEMDLCTGKLVWSDEAARLLGYRPGEVEPTMERFLDRVHPDDREAVQQAILGGMRRTDGRYSVEYRVRGADDSPRILSARGTVHFDAEGRPLRITGTALDVTRERRIEQDLSIQKERYRLVIEHAEDLIVRTDVEGRFEFVSPSYCLLFGLTEEQLIGRNYLPLVHPDDREATLQVFSQLLRPPHTGHVEQRAWTVRGWRWLHWFSRALLDDGGVVTGIVATGRDITERKEAEIALRHREAMERELRDLSAGFLRPFPHGIDPVIQSALGRVGRFTASDRAYVFLRDASREVVSNTHEWTAAGVDPMIDRLQNVPLDRTPAAVRKLAAGVPVVIPSVAALGPDWAAERAVLEKQGIRSVLLVPLVFGNSLAGAVGFDSVKAEREWSDADVRLLQVFGDLLASTIQRERIHADLMAARERETISHLASGVAHDFNNLLGVLDANIEYLREVLGESAAAYGADEVLDETRSAVSLAKVVTSGMLSLSRGGPVPVAPVPLAETVEDLIRIARQVLPATIQLEVDLEPGLVAQSHAAFLQAALLNLTLNARDAMPHGGTLRIEVRRTVWTGARSLLIGTPPQGAVGMLRIADSGYGMAPEVLARTFEPHFSTKAAYRGHGLGMYMVQEFVLRSGAGLWVESRPGQGTEFRILMPLSGAPVSVPHDGVPEAAARNAAGKRVIVVDDDPGIRLSLGRLLASWGIDHVAVASGRECLESLCRDPDVALVVSDIGMEGMDGYALGRKLRVLWPSLPVMLMTGREPVDGQPDPGGFPLLRKPLDTKALQAVLRGLGLLPGPGTPG